MACIAWRRYEETKVIKQHTLTILTILTPGFSKRSLWFLEHGLNGLRGTALCRLGLGMTFLWCSERHDSHLLSGYIWLKPEMKKALRFRHLPCCLTGVGGKRSASRICCLAWLLKKASGFGASACVTCRSWLTSKPAGPTPYSPRSVQ